jgi:hypothetical protein
MATALTTSFGYTYPGIVSTNVLFKPTEDTPAISEMVTVDQGISFRKRYNLLTSLSKILKPYTGCARTYSGSKVITDIFLETKEFQVGLEWCKDDFTQQLTSAYNLLAQEYLKTGNESFNPEGTEVNSIITKLIDDAVRRDVFRRFSFGAQDSSSADWSQIDGLWTRLIDTSGGSNYCVRRVTGTSLGTAALAADEARDVLKAAWLQSSNLLKQIPKSSLTYWVTGSIYDNWIESLQGTGAVTEQAIENIQKGITTLTYNGIKVRPVRIWDTELEDTDNPLNATTRHLVLLTAKENHIFGCESSADLNKIEGWYERKDRKYYFEGDMKFGYQYLHCDLQTIAY